MVRLLLDYLVGVNVTSVVLSQVLNVMQGTLMSNLVTGREWLTQEMNWDDGSPNFIVKIRRM